MVAAKTSKSTPRAAEARLRRGDTSGTGFPMHPERQGPQLGCPTFSSWPRSELMTCGECAEGAAAEYVRGKAQPSLPGLLHTAVIACPGQQRALSPQQQCCTHGSAANAVLHTEQQRLCFTQNSTPTDLNSSEMSSL